MKLNISALQKLFYPLPRDPIPQSAVSAFTATISINMFRQPWQWKGSLLFCWGYGRLPLERCITGSPPHCETQLYGTCAHPFLQIQVHFCTVVTCQIHLPNATAHNHSHRGVGKASEVPERLKDRIHETRIPQVPKACGTKGSGASLEMRRVKLKKDLSLLPHFLPAELLLLYQHRFKQ